MTDQRTSVEIFSNRAWWGLAAAVFVLGGYCGLAGVTSGRVAPRVSVGGVAIGGMTAQEATATLQRAVASKTSIPVHLTAPSGAVDIQPATAGLQVDLRATVSGLTGYTLSPGHLWSHLTGGQAQPFALRIDRVKLSAAVTAAARTLARPVSEGSISFGDGKATTVQPVAGFAVRVPETCEAVASAWPLRRVVRAIAAMTEPKVSSAELSRASKELAVPAMMAPVTILAGSDTFALAPRTYGPALSATADRAGRLQLRIDIPTLMAAIRTTAPKVERPGVDATVRLVAGRPHVVVGVEGTGFDEPAVAAAFRVALTSSPRTVTIGLVPAPPKVTAAMAAGWQIKEPISTFTSAFPVNPPRTTNIKIAIATLNGTVIRPGGQFSLNATLGQRTAAKGYQKAPVIYSGRLVSDYGGGVSQVSTSVFNAAFFAGVKIDEHTAHSFYIARYPEGREATVSWPDVDQKWTNDTGSGILIQSVVQGDSIIVTLWGTKTRDVKAVQGPRRNVVQPKKIVDPRPGCVTQSPTPGFDVTVTQVFMQNGAQVRSVPFSTHYIPEDTVTCTHLVPVPVP
jgi:vancomycin resistance protein YoaR